MSLKTVGKYIRYKREALGYTRTSFEDEHNISSGYLANVECGFNRPSSSMLTRFAKILKVTPGLLLDLMSDEITFEEALIIEAQTARIKGGLGALETGGFIFMPKNFAQEDTEFIEAIAGLLAEFIEKYKKPNVSDFRLDEKGKEVG